MTMKKLLLLFTAITLVSCADASLTTEQIIEANATEFIKNNMNDPESFEFVEIISIDTVTKIQLYELELRISNMDLERANKYLSEANAQKQKSLDMQVKYKHISESSKETLEEIISDANKLIEKHTEAVELHSKAIEGYTNLLTNAAEDDIAQVDAIIKVRGNNSYGAKVLSTYTVIMNEDLSIRTATPKK